MRVLVTGASGFLGRHVVERLRGEHEVLSLVRTPPKDGEVRGDVLDPSSLRAAMDGCDAVVHAAGGVSHAPADAARMFEVHVTGTSHVLAAARSTSVRRLVHVGSSGTTAVSADRRTHDEGAPGALSVVAQWPYYRAKLFAEQALTGVEGCEVVVLAPSLLLGPGDLRGGATRAVKYLLDGDVPAAPPGGICFVDARDVADAVASALVVEQPAPRYLLGAANWTFADFYARLARIAEVPAPAVKLPKSTRRLLSVLPRLDPTRWGTERFGGFGSAGREDLEFGCYWWWVDSAAAERDLGWSPRDPHTTLADTVYDLRRRV